MFRTDAAPTTLTAEEVREDAAAEAASRRYARHVAAECERTRSLPTADFRAARAQLLSEACGEHPQTGEPYYTPEAFIAEMDLRAEMGYSTPQVGVATILGLRRVDLVPNMRLRDEFRRLFTEGAVSAQRVAFLIGETRNGPNGETVGDGTRLERLLGLETTANGVDAHGVPRPHNLRLFIPADMAARIADALGMSYQDAGV